MEDGFIVSGQRTGKTIEFYEKMMVKIAEWYERIEKETPVMFVGKDIESRVKEEVSRLPFRVDVHTSDVVPNGVAYITKREALNFDGVLRSSEHV